MTDWNRIADHYRRIQADLVACGPSRWGCDPYAWEHEAGIRLTPIEFAAWCDIRYLGLVLYPQYPVGRFFVDFANPSAQVAIECDGAAFHKDKARDASRQAAIEARGWVVYRISGSDCVKNDDEGDEDDEFGRPKFGLNPCTLTLLQIANRHGIRIGSRNHGVPACA